MKAAFPTPEQNKMLLKMAEQKLDCLFPEGQCIAFMDEDRIAGIVVYFNYRPPSIEVAIYCDDYRWALNRDMVAMTIAYPFMQLGCQRITALVNKNNKRSRKMVKKLGFVEEGKLRNAAESGDVFVYGLLPEDFKLRKYRGQEIATSATAAA